MIYGDGFSIQVVAHAETLAINYLKVNRVPVLVYYHLRKLCLQDGQGVVTCICLCLQDRQGVVTCF